MPGPSLTIAIPFYRNVEYLRRTLESIFAQPLLNSPVLLVDNSDAEAERQAAEGLASSYPPEKLRYVRAERHVSACENFNRCIELAETDLVSMVHGDDEVLPCYEQELLGLAKRHPDAAVLFLAVRIIDEESEPRFSPVDWFKTFLMPRGRGDFILSDQRSLQSIVRGDWINGAAVCYRKSALGDLRWDPCYPMASDLDLWSRVILSGRSMAGTRQPPAYSYRRHKAQTSVSLTAGLARFQEESRVLDLIADRATMHGWYSVAATAKAKGTLQLHLLFLALQDIAAGSVGTALEKLRFLRSIRRRHI